MANGKFAHKRGTSRKHREPMLLAPAEYVPAAPKVEKKAKKKGRK